MEHEPMRKIEMAQVIVQELFALPALPAASDLRVCKQTLQKLAVVERRYKLALRVAHVRHDIILEQPR
jgi:hypothetical protein